jgi:hypothetical protein
MQSGCNIVNISGFIRIIHILQEDVHQGMARYEVKKEVVGRVMPVQGFCGYPLNYMMYSSDGCMHICLFSDGRGWWKTHSPEVW